jgi:hypothetical protein
MRLTGGGSQLTRRVLASEPGTRPDHDGMDEGHDRTFLPPTSGPTVGQGGPRRARRPGGGMGHLGQARAQSARPRRVVPDRCVPARASWPGATPGQTDRRLVVPTRRLSVPHAATHRAAPRWSTPALVSRTAIACTTGLGGPGASRSPARAPSPGAPARSRGGGAALATAPRPRVRSPLRVPIGSSRTWRWATGRGNSRRGWSRISPVGAGARRGRGVRLRPWASSAIVAGSARPCSQAAKRARVPRRPGCPSPPRPV